MKTTCGIFIINSDKRILLVHPTNHPDNFWSIPKGIQNIDETHKEAALREVYEETNLKLKSSKVFLLKDINDKKSIIYKSNKKDKKLVTYYYISDIDISNNIIICNSLVYKKDKLPFPENDKHGWATYKQAKKLAHYSQQSFIESLYKQNLIK